MLDILKRGTVPLGGQTWEYHGDTGDGTIFYVTPQPAWATRDGLPEIQLVEYETSDELNGSGYCTLSVELAVSDAALEAIRGDIQQRFGVESPRFLTLPFQTGTVVSLTYPDGEGGTTGVQADGTDFGGNAAIFQLPLGADQMKTIRSTLAGLGSGPFEVEYSIVVPGQVPAVTMELSFDSQTAFEYEVAAQEHTHWASSSTYTYDVTELLSQSNAARVEVTRTDPRLSDDAVARLTDLGQAMIASLVSQQVQRAVQLQHDAGGSQPFSISQVASFRESYQESEVILWRLQPQAILPSFGDLGLTPGQIGALQPTVDKRQFVTQVTPQCRFASSADATPHDDIEPDGGSSFLSGVRTLSSLDVTIFYPTLRAAEDRTHTFTDNTPVTWQGDWDGAAGGTYTLGYVANYADGTRVSGKVESLDDAAYTLGLADIGTLNVTFDASRFFTSSAGPLVEEVTVDLVFNLPQEPPFLESATLVAGSAQHTFSSVFAGPLEAGYFYTVTYGFVPGAKANPYTSDAKSQNGQWVRLEEPDSRQAMNVVVEIEPKDPGGATVIEADINFYYNGKPYFPDIPASRDLPRPMANSPIQLNFPDDSGKAAQMQQVTFFANSKVTPVTVSATVLTSAFDTIQIGPFDFTPQVIPLMPISPSKQFAVIGADPAIVDWTSQPLTGITVDVTEVRYTLDGNQVKTGTPTPAQRIGWDTPTSQAYAVQFVVTGLPNGYTALEFDWYAEYVYQSGTRYATGTQRSTLLALPPRATDPAPPPAR